MPIYTYQCPACGNIVERIVRFGDRDEPIACGRLLSRGRVVAPNTGRLIDPVPCKGSMVRYHEIELTARTPGGWKP